MLVLIAGITGNLGQRLAKAAIARGLSVRGLSRSSSKLHPDLLSSLESFISCTSYFDITALETAVHGVDAVICAYSPDPIMDLDAQLLLLRAAERSGIKTFLASSWNHDWTQIKYGDLEFYDNHIAFEKHIAMTSEVKPVYMFTGSFADLLFTQYAPGGFDTSGDRPKIRYWGDGDERKWHWSAPDDVAEWTVGILSRKDVQEGKGGFFKFQSGAVTHYEMADVYEKVTGVKVDVVREGELEDLEAEVERMRRELGRDQWIRYLPLASTLLGTKGKWVMTGFTAVDGGKKPTTLEEYLRASIKQ